MLWKKENPLALYDTILNGYNQIHALISL